MALCIYILAFLTIHSFWYLDEKALTYLNLVYQLQSDKWFLTFQKSLQSKTLFGSLKGESQELIISLKEREVCELKAVHTFMEF